MCLISYYKPKRATDVIYCYKVVQLKDDKLYPPIYNLNKPYKFGKNWAGCGSYDLSSNSLFMFGKGWFHAFLKKDTAVKFARALWNGKDGSELTIVQCIIPRKTRYTIATNRNDICAKYMIFPK